MNAEFSRAGRAHGKPEVLPGLSSVQFGRNIIILKKAGSEDRAYLHGRSRYPFSHLLPEREQDALPGNAPCS